MKNRVFEEFLARFGSGARLYAAPGRVNLIGEHTDYNGGFVLPGAIDRCIWLAVRPAAGRRSRIWSVDFDEGIELNIADEPPRASWARYIYGVVSEMARRGVDVPAFDAVFGGDIPSGAGLSSSAALESVFAFALNDLSERKLTPVELARAGQMTEHRYIGVRCGIMDQMISLLGERDRVMRLDCRSLEYEMIPFRPEGCRLVLIDSMVSHSLAGTEYNLRRSQCERGVAIIARHVPRVTLLRDVGLDMLDTYRSEMDEWVYRRCRYVIEENVRLLIGCDRLRSGDYAGFGEKMFESHRGLSQEYGVSCGELDFIQEIARGCDGVLGSRMMGGGFGGCVLNLVSDGACESFLDEVDRRYAARYGLHPRTIDVVIGGGARRLE